jgi:disulfide bond formation protein DsbB
VPVAGIEPARPYRQQILSLPRLPVPPYGQNLSAAKLASVWPFVNTPSGDDEKKCYHPHMNKPMTQILAFITPARFGSLTALLALGVLATAYISQYVFGLYPCTLCLWQRVPYALMILSGLILIWTRSPRLSVILMIAVILLWATSLGLSFYHYGVEEKWWIFGGGCSTALYSADLNTSDLLAQIKNAPVTRCDEAVNFLFGMSMAFYNILLSFAGLVLSLCLTIKQLQATR